MAKSKKISSKYIPEQLALGASVEMEHTDNPAEAMKIAMDHLNEDPHYYTKLVEMEAKPKLADGGSLGMAEFSPAMKQNYSASKKQKFENGGSAELEEGYAAKMKKSLEPGSDIDEDEINKRAAFRREERRKIANKDIREKNELQRRMGEEFTKGLEKDEEGEYIEYANGGTTGKVFKGDSFAGDKIDAKVNAGEMILNLEHQQRLLDLLQNKFADGGVKWKYNKGEIPNMEAAIEEKAKLLKERDALEKAATAGRNFKPQLAQKAAQLGLIDDIIAKGGHYAIPALMKAGILKVALGPEVSAASEALGSEDVGAGSDVVEGEPTFSETEAARKEIEKTELPNPYKAKLESKMADGGRVDEQVDSGKLKINKDQQSRLLEVLRGNLDISELGNDSIIHAEDGAAVDIPSTIAAPDENASVLPAELQNTVAPLNASVPTPMNTTLPLPSNARLEALKSASATLPPSMQFTGAGIPTPAKLTMPESVGYTGGAQFDVTKPAPVDNVPMLDTLPTQETVNAAKANIKQQRSQAIAKVAADAEAVENEKAFKEFTDKKLAEEDAKKAEELKGSVWNKDSTANKILSAIAIGLGAIGAGMTGGKNYALEIINKAIDTDMENKKLSKSSELAEREYKLKTVELGLKQQAAKMDNKVKQAQLNKWAQEMELQREMVNMERRRLSTVQANMASGQGDVYNLLNDEEKKRYVPGYGVAKDVKSAETANNSLALGEQLKAETDKIEQLWSKYGTREVLDRGAVAAENSARRSMQIQLKELFNLGVLNGPDLDLLNEYTGEDFLSLTTTDAAKRAKLDAVKAFTQNKIDAHLKAAALPKSKDTQVNEMRLQAMKNAYPKATDAEIITSLKNKGLWK